MRTALALIFSLFVSVALADSLECDGSNVNVEYIKRTVWGWERVVLKVNRIRQEVSKNYEYVHFTIGCWKNPKGKQYIIYQAYCGGSGCNDSANWGIIDPVSVKALLEPSNNNREKAEELFGGSLPNFH